MLKSSPSVRSVKKVHGEGLQLGMCPPFLALATFLLSIYTYIAYCRKLNFSGDYLTMRIFDLLVDFFMTTR